LRPDGTIGEPEAETEAVADEAPESAAEAEGDATEE
jgi:hypothetical protein